MTDVIENAVVTEYIPGEQDKKPNYYWGTTVSNWFILSNIANTYYKIFANMLSDDMLDDLVFNFNYNIPISIRNGACIDESEDDNVVQKLTIDLLMKKLDGMTKLIVEKDNLNITYLPNTLTSITVKGSDNNIDLSQCTNLKECNFDNEYIYGKRELIIPFLPDCVEKVYICSDNIDCNSFNFPSSVQEITIYSPQLNCDISNWPCNLKKLIISGKSYSVSMLPHTLEYLSLSGISYTNMLDIPPNLTVFKFCMRVQYEYILDIPDGVKELTMNYDSYPGIETLPKSCKKFTYSKCPNDVFTAFCKAHKRKGILITK